MKRFVHTIFFIFIGSVFAAGQNPKAKYGTFALTHASIETITKGTIANGTVIVKEGKIAAVGNDVAVPPGAEVIDCTGLWIYPGMIDGGSRLGLFEFGQVSQATDVSELGDVVPQMKALTAVNPNSASIPITRVNGVTTALTVPEGDLFSGTASLINLHGYTSEQMYAGFDAVVLNYPRTGRRGLLDRRTEEEIKKTTDTAIERLNEVWEKAVEFHMLDSATGGKGQYYPEMQALLPVVRGEMSLIVDVNASKDILSALKWIKEKKIRKVIFTGVSEGWRAAKEIAEAKIPVITGPVLDLPGREYDRYDKAYANAGIMRKAGIKVAIKTDSKMLNNRNLPYHAGFAAAYGMGREEALRAITIVPAEIFGVDDRLGSIEQGKSATLFVCDGDPLETKTQVKHVFIGGWQIPMVSRQTLLYEEFLKREPGLKIDK
jgi:imidazolonepropionase-like amidohydrolase